MKILSLLFAFLCFATISVRADNSVACNICNYVVPLAEGYIRSGQYSVATIEGDLTSVCAYFGAFQDQCATLVTTYTQQIVQQLVNGVASDQICYELYICPNERQPQPMKINIAAEKVGDDSLQCQICTYAVPLVEEYLKAGNVNVTWIENQLQSICTFLPAPYSSLCDTVIQTYADKIIQELENGTPADQVCQQVGLCTSSATKPIKMMKLTPKPLKLDINRKAFNPSDDSLQCQICDYAVPLIEEYIQSTKWNTSYIEAQIQQAVCSWLPAPYNTLCNTFVQTYTEPIIQELESGTPASQVCGNLGLCVSLAKLSAMKFTSPQDDSLQCQMCTYAVPLIEEYLQSANCNTTCIENQVDQYLCDWLPAPYSTLCATFVNTYTGEIIDQLEKGTPADQVCQELALCQSSNKKPIKPIMKINIENVKPAKVGDDSLQCQICDYAVPLIEEYIQSTKWNTSYIEAQIQQAVCSWLPAPYNTLCNTFVQTYTEPIIQELESGTPASQVCSNLGLCVSKNRVVALNTPISPRDDSLQCQICTYAVPLVEEYLQSANCNETCIENELDQAVCSWLPSPYSTLCGTFVDTYTGPIIEELEKGTPADQVCSSLGLCTSSKPMKLNMNNGNKKQKVNIA